MMNKLATIAEMARIHRNEDELPKINGMLARNWRLVEHIKKCHGEEMIELLGPPRVNRIRISKDAGTFIEVVQEARVDESVEVAYAT